MPTDIGAPSVTTALITQMHKSSVDCEDTTAGLPRTLPSLGKARARFGSTNSDAMEMRVISTIADSTCIMTAVTVKMLVLSAQERFKHKK